MKKLPGILLLLCVVSLTACNMVAEPNAAPPNPTPIPQTWIQMTNRSDERVLLTTNRFPLDNCSGSRPAASTIGREQSVTVTTELSLTGSIEAGIQEVVQIALEAAYSVQNGETKTETLSYQVEVDPMQQVVYLITWYEVWQTGSIRIEQLNLNIPYRVRVGLEGELSSEPGERCHEAQNIALDMTSQPETPQPTYTIPPTYTAHPTYTPQPTYTVQQANTSAPTTTHLPTEVPTQIMPTISIRTTTTTASNGYPCDGEVVFSSGGLLNQVHVSPLLNSPRRTAVQQGSTVYILEKRSSEGSVWYQINYASGTQTGWILTEYITPAASCPR